MPRDYNFEIMPEIKARYSTRFFSDDKISNDELMPVFEAARYAPSAYNEQPWRFLIGNNDKTHELLGETLAAGNAWAKAAPVLILVMATKNFVMTGEANAHNRFDAGTASGFLQLEAVRCGLVTHNMSGFDANKARELLNISGELDIISLIALGKPAAPEQTQDEIPGTRNPLNSIFIEAQ